jgi:type VI secretion system secreted protein Hcp
MASNTSFVDYFLKIDGLAGTSTDEQYKGAFEIKDFSFGVENPTTIGSATGGAGAGKAKFNEFTIKKTSDKASPLFFRSCAAGTHYMKVTLYCRKAGGDPNTAGGTFLKIAMSDVLVSSYESGIAGPSQPAITVPVDAAFVGDVIVLGTDADATMDSLALNYANIAMTSNPTTFTVTPATAGMLTFDAKTGTFTVREAPGGVFTVGTDGGIPSLGAQEFDVSNLLPLINSGNGVLTLTVDEVRSAESSPSGNKSDLDHPAPDLHFDVLFYAPADLELTPEDLSRKGKLLGSLHVQPARDPASLELNFANEVREAAVGTFGIRLELRGTQIDWSGPGDEGPEEMPGRDVNGSFRLSLNFDTN